MAREDVAVIILAAGKGTRMKSDRPKVMHSLANRPMINHLLDTVGQLHPARVVVVIGPEMDEVAQAVAPHSTVIQAERLGTGHAVAQARQALGEFSGDVLIVYGDTPLITFDTLSRMLAKRRERSGTKVVVLGFVPPLGGEYGRLVVGPDGGLQAIVEYREATPEQRGIALCNSGVMAVDGAALWGLIDRLGNDNSKGEYYLTDIVALAGPGSGGYVEGSPEELLGVNSRQELAAAEAVVQQRLRHRAMDDGATLIDPSAVTFSFDTICGRDVVIYPQVIFGPKVSVGDGVTIKGFCHIEGATIADGAEIGPFARLRPGAEIGHSAHIGNFVEVKKAVIEDGAKVNHLTYIGDARVGAGANVGAGTITCNYDGFTKAFTEIGKGAFIGSNSSLVAPVKVGDGAVVGAGSVVTKDVPDGALAVSRATQMALTGWADRFRARKQAEKDAKRKG